MDPDDGIAVAAAMKPMNIASQTERQSSLRIASKRPSGKQRGAYARAPGTEASAPIITERGLQVVAFCAGVFLLMWALFFKFHHDATATGNNASAQAVIMQWNNNLDSPLAVTKLLVVQSTTSQDDALGKCHDLGPFTSGIGVNLFGDWYPFENAYFCQQQRPLLALEGQERVLQSLVVVNKTEGQSCDALTLKVKKNSWRMEVIPIAQSGIQVCAVYETAQQALQTGRFVRSVTTTFHLDHFMRGWNLVNNVSVSLTDDCEMFLATLEVAIPLAEIRKLSLSSDNTTVSATTRAGLVDDPCIMQYGPHFRLVAGFEIQNSTHDVLCFARVSSQFWTNELTLLRESIIVNLELIQSNVPCTDSLADRIEWNALSIGSSDSSSYSSISTVRTLALCISRVDASLGENLSNLSFVTEIFVDPGSGPRSKELVGDIRFGQDRQMFMMRRSTFRSIKYPAKNSEVTPNLSSSKLSILKARLQTEDSNNPSLSFRIVQFADLHFTGKLDHQKCRSPPYDMDSLDCTEALLPPFMQQVLDVEKPDLVVFSGDNVDVESYEAMFNSLDTITKVVESRKIPFALVFGNHDAEFDKNATRQAKVAMMQYLIETKPLFVGEIGPLDVYGVGNYVLRVVNPSDTSEPVLSLYFLDSNDHFNDSSVHSLYDWIHQSQVDLYLQLSNQMQQPMSSSNNNSKRSVPPPGMMFFHIPLPEFALDSDRTRHGTKQDVSTPSRLNSQLVDALVTMKEVKAVFVGHEHTNDYCTLQQGIQLCFGGGMGFGQAYGSHDFPRRSRVIEWQMDLTTQRQQILSWKRMYDHIEARSMNEVLFSSP